MSAVSPAAPFPVLMNPNKQAVHSNDTVVASGSVLKSGYGAKEVSLIVNITAPPTGTGPTLAYTLQEVDPGNGVTPIGASVSTPVMDVVELEVVTLRTTVGGAFLITWTVGGLLPSFAGVYATLVSKATAPVSGWDINGVERTLSTDAKGDLVIIGDGTAGAPGGNVVTVQGVIDGLPLPVQGVASGTPLPTQAMSVQGTPAGDTFQYPVEMLSELRQIRKLLEILTDESVQDEE